MIISLNFTCRDFNFKLRFIAVKLTLRAKIKLYSCQNFLVCRDIEIRVATFSTLGGTSHPLVVKENISSMCYDVATTSFQRKFSCRDFSFKTQCTEIFSFLSNSKIFSITQINFTQQFILVLNSLFIEFI